MNPPNESSERLSVAAQAAAAAQPPPMSVRKPLAVLFHFGPCRGFTRTWVSLIKFWVWVAAKGRWNGRWPIIG